MMKTDIEKLKEQFVNASDDASLEAIDKEMHALAEKDIDTFANELIACAREANKVADELLLKEKLATVLPFISVSTLSKTYFKRSPQWFYQRLNGSTVNGKTVKFNSTELHTLSQALTDIAKKINQAAAFVL